VSIRDEFRRAWRILLCIGSGKQPEGALFAQLDEAAAAPQPPDPETAAASPAETPLDTVLPGLIDLSLSEHYPPSDAGLNMEEFKTAFIPLHLRGRNVGDVRPPPGF
jgi:hypothetical protein